MSNLARRVGNLEEQAGGKWPVVIVWRDLWATDTEYAATVLAKVRATGWTGPVGDYPGKLVIVAWDADT